MRTLLISLISFLILLSCSVSTLYAQTNSEEGEWYWYDADSVRHTRAELDTILAHHKIWVLKFKQYLLRNKKANETLYEAILRILYHAPFNSSLLELQSDSLRADLEGLDLTGARLEDVDLTGTQLNDANLTGAWMPGADLTGVWFVRTKLNGAWLNNTDLTGAMLIHTNLSQSNLYWANMYQVLFEPDSLPRPQDIALARNLSQMRFSINPGPLIELRNRFDKAGYRKQAKEVNAAYRRTDDTWLETFLYDWTCAYGIAYNRPFIILGVGIFVFGALYFNFARVFRSGPYNYLVATRKGCRKERDEGEEDWQEVRSYWRTVGVALLFSLQRALRIGYRQFSPDSWIKMMLPPKLEITSRGWPRFVSALQSIIGIGLVILALLSYFGSPFEY